ncbi:MAG: macrocin O-methyltransferase [Chitinophagaceae bacterium]
MKLFFIRYTKIAFCFLRLHVLFNIFSRLWLQLYYITKLSKCISENKNIAYNDFPSKWKYEKRYDLYNWIFENEGLKEQPINYLEFGVADGHSFKWFLQQNNNSQSCFFGFDTFTGLPEDFGAYKKGMFNTNNKVPQLNDERAAFFQGLFQQTLPGFLKNFDTTRRNVIMMDADLYSSTVFVLTSLAPYLKKNDIILFDQFAVPTHEFRAFKDFTESYYINLKLIGAANNYYFAAFVVV